MKNTIQVILCLLFSIALSGQTVSAGLQVHYKFAGSLVDEIASENNLQVDFGTLKFGEVPLEGYKSLIFDSETRVSQIGSFDNSNFMETAVATWVKSSKVTNELQIVIQGAHIGFGIYIQGDTGHLMGLLGGSSQNAYVSSKPITDGRWHHVVAQSDGETTSVYIDGVLDGTSSTDGFHNGTGGSNNKIYMGRSNLDDYFYTGEAYDVRVYNRVLNLCEIDTLSNKQISFGMTSEYDFEESLEDSSTSNNDLVNAGGEVSFIAFNDSDSAVYFDGESRLVSTNSFDNSDHTATAISLWMNSTKITEELQILLQGANIGFGVYLEANTGKLLGFFGGSSQHAYVSQEPVTDGKWHHIVAQSDGITTSVYIDGILDGVTTNDGFFTGDGGPDNVLYLGKNNQDAFPYSGAINDLKIHDRILSICEISELKTKNVPTGIFELDRQEDALDVRLFPNPTDGNITIELDEIYKTIVVGIYTRDGRKLQQESFENANEVNLNLQLLKGYYVVQISADGTLRSLPVLKL